MLGPPARPGAEQKGLRGDTALAMKMLCVCELLFCGAWSHAPTLFPLWMSRDAGVTAGAGLGLQLPHGATSSHCFPKEKGLNAGLPQWSPTPQQCGADSRIPPHQGHSHPQVLE